MQLEKILGQPCIVENRVGMQGQVGLQAVARAVPDGYTIARADNTSLIIGPSFTDEPLVDSQNDFAPISLDQRGFLGSSRPIVPSCSNAPGATRLARSRQEN
jgi:tripartite-type tricarboxylate transporter receptor subunit TctC